MQVSEVDIWADADASLCAEIQPDGDERDDEDEWGNSKSETRLASLRARVVRMPDGEIHVCSSACAFAVDHGEGDRVCPFTGNVVGRACEDRTDNSTGRSSYSADPDMAGPQLGGWRKKRCMIKASSSAFRDARLLDDSEMPVAVAAPLSTRAGVKRGALCVDEQVPDDAPKRARNSKKRDTSYSTLALLVNEATGIFSKLTKHTKTSKERSRGTVAGPPIDVRLLNHDLLFTASLKKYLKETLASGGFPCLDEMNNISLAVTSVITNEKRKRAEAAAAGTSSSFSIGFRSGAARLAVALWTASCKTEYIANARRGSDSFKSFCCGVFYGFKRGITLDDGTVLVPKNPKVAAAMPAAKTINTDSSLKSLHASSHRGLCTLHRCIASVPPESALDFFDEVVRAARAL